MFPAAERLFLAESLRWVEHAEVVDAALVQAPTLWMPWRPPARRSRCARRTRTRRCGRPPSARACRTAVVTRAARAGFPVPDPAPPPPGTPRVVVTGCYDWLHSGHIRFFMDAAAYGALYAVVGSDRNVELLKGAGHPLQREEERRYMVGAVKSVHQCLVSSGSGWMDAEPEIAAIGATHYVVNEDGDQPEKREFCRAHGIEYVVLQRVPHAGLPGAVEHRAAGLLGAACPTCSMSRGTPASRR